MKKVIVCLFLSIVCILSACAKNKPANSSGQQSQNQSTSNPCKNGHLISGSDCEVTYVYPTATMRGKRIIKCSRCGADVTEELISFKERVDPYLKELIARIRDSLIDPDSMIYEGKVYIVKPVDSEYYGSNFVVVISYNAKNRLGGYAGYRTRTAGIRNFYGGGMRYYPAVGSTDINKLSVSFFTGEPSGKIDNYSGDTRYEYLYSFSN